MIVDSNLEELIKEHKIVENLKAYDTSCITLTLDQNIRIYDVPEENVIEYENDDISTYVKKITINRKNGYTIEPKKAILACSREKIKMPKFCFGLLQTKGSLARLFVFLNCADGQVDPGYNGKITFEIFNASEFKIKIRPGQAVGNLYLFNTSMESKGYNGRYQNATSPTFSKLK